MDGVPVLVGEICPTRTVFGLFWESHPLILQLSFAHNVSTPLHVHCWRTNGYSDFSLMRLLLVVVGRLVFYIYFIISSRFAWV